MIDERSKTIILCSILKRSVKESLITQLAIAEKMGKSKQFVSFVMNGTQTASPSFVSGVLSLCGKEIRFNYNDQFRKRMSELLEDYLSEYCYLSDDYYLKKAQDHLTDDAYYSYACPEYLAMQCGVCYRTNKMNDLVQWIEIIDCYFVEAMAQNKKAFLLYLLIKSEWLLDNHNYTSALETLKEAKEQASSSCILGIIDLFRGIAEIHLSNYLKALEYFQNSEKLLLESRVYGRTLAATKNIGSCYAYLQFYDKAEEQFKIALKEAKRLKRRDLENACYISLCSTLFKQGRFEEAIIYGERISENEESIHFIPLAWSYYFNNDIKMCKKYRDKLSLRNNDYHQMMAELLDMYLTEATPESKISQLQKMMDYSREKQGQNNVIWCLKFLINEYKKQGNYEKVAEYQEVILKSLGYRTFFVEQQKNQI